MKKMATVLICIFIVNEIFAQSSNGISPSESLIFYSPSNLISKIRLVEKKIVEDKIGIEFTFIVERRDALAKINLNSIQLKSVDNKILNLNKRYRDTVYYDNGGSIHFSTIHLMDKNDIDFIKLKDITTLILSVNEIPLQIKIARRSQLMIKKLANRNY